MPVHYRIIIHPIWVLHQAKEFRSMHEPYTTSNAKHLRKLKKPQNHMTPLGGSEKEKLYFNRKKLPAEPGSERGGHLLQPVGVRLTFCTLFILKQFLIIIIVCAFTSEKTYCKQISRLLDLFFNHERY